MIKLSTTRLLTLLCIVSSLTILASCDKNKDATSSSKIELLSFGPTGAKPGDTLRFFGTNLDQVTSIQLTGATVDKADFKLQTGSEILIIIPPSTEKGFVTLKTPQGDIVSKTQFNLGITIAVTSMTLQARPGDNITINGNYLNWVTSVTFEKNKVVTAFVTKTLNQLVVTVPADAETGPLVLRYAGTIPLDFQTKDTLKVTLPVSTSFSPNPVKHADNVTITGTNLDLVKQVFFNGVATAVTTFVSQSATQLVVKVPGGATKGKVTLVPASGVPSVSTTDLDVVLPAITSFTPSPVDPGANLTINGTNLNLVTSVAFQNAPAVTTFVSQSATQIVVRVPTGVLRGKITLGVLNSSLTVQSNDILEITGSVPPPVLTLPIYTDVVTTNWNGWIGGGWGGTSDRNSSTPVREGTKSIAINYVGGYGSPLQLGGANISLTPYTTFKISVYGAAGSNGKRVTLGINGVNGKYIITIVEGKWTDYAVPLSTLTTATSLNEIWVQEYSGTGGFTVYVDAIGLF